MLVRFYELRDTIECFLHKHKPPNDESAFSLAEDTLTDNDWLEVKQLIDLLTPFENITKLLQGNATRTGSEGAFGSLWEVLPALQVLFEHLNAAEAKCSTSSIKLGIQFGLEKMNDYWAKLIFSTDHYIAATTLHPSLNIAWFDDHWRQFPSWVKHAKSTFSTYASEANKPAVEVPHNEEPPVKRIRLDNPTEDAFLNILQIDRDLTSNPRHSKSRASTEYKEWLKFRPNTNEIIRNPLAWWINELNQNPQRFPTLGRMAIDIFSAPAMSAECERVFSRAKQVVTVERNRLKASTIEANECQKDWLCKGLVRSWLKREDQEFLRMQRDMGVPEAVESSQCSQSFQMSQTEVETHEEDSLDEESILLSD